MRSLKVELADGTADSFSLNNPAESHQITTSPDGSISIELVTQDDAGSIVDQPTIARYADGEWLTTEEG